MQVEGGEAEMREGGGKQRSGEAADGSACCPKYHERAHLAHGLAGVHGHRRAHHYDLALILRRVSDPPCDVVPAAVRAVSGVRQQMRTLGTVQEETKWGGEAMHSQASPGQIRRLPLSNTASLDRRVDADKDDLRLLDCLLQAGGEMQVLPAQFVAQFIQSWVIEGQRPRLASADRDGVVVKDCELHVRHPAYQHTDVND